jgi:hypothetical protein
VKIAEIRQVIKDFAEQNPSAYRELMRLREVFKDRTSVSQYWIGRVRSKEQQKVQNDLEKINENQRRIL